MYWSETVFTVISICTPWKSSEIKLTLNFVTAMRLFSPKSIGSSSSAPAVC